MRLPSVPVLMTTAVAAVCAPSLRAQWATFQDQTSSRLVAASGLGSADPQEKDYAWADFDQDGDTDLVVVRKSPATSNGHFPNVLLMNEAGVLTDRTTALASASLIPGSQGMLDATNDRDVVIADVNGDGWKDVVTCTTLTAGNPQYIRVPRVYINRGDDLAGNWLGFLYDDALRIDDTPWGGNHRFCSVAAGDIDGDGDIDLYFGDYQQGGARPTDIDDRLLLNNGAGYFTDVTAARMSAVMVESSFAMKVEMVDMNLDGKLDILKDDALNAPQGISVSYNDGASPGFFSTYNTIYGNAPYHFHISDLNNDNLPDMIVSDDAQDRYQLHTGVVGGVATFGPTISFTYSGGGADDGFGGNNIVADLNNDGWKDVIIADFDVDVTGCGRRTHIFRNLGNAPNVTLQEQLVSGAVVGIPTGMLAGTYDVAVFDINGDGWNDMVMGRCAGTTVWMNQPPIGITFAYPGGLPSFIAPGVAHTLNVTATGIGGVVPQAGSGRLWTSINNAPFTQSVMTDTGAGQYQGTLPAMANCADNLRFYVTANGQSSTYTDPPTAPSASYSVVGAVALNTIYSNNFEVASTGWTVTNTALTSGAWQVATPIGTTVGAQFAAPNEDGEASTSATKCWVTQNGVVGGTAGAADVDGGPTDLTSPPLDFTGTDGFISYRRWFFCNTAEDNLTVSVSNNGTTWVNVEVVAGAGHNTWVTRQFKVSDYVVPSSTVRVRFRTSDNPNNSTTEAGVDVFKADAFGCVVCQEQIALATNGTGVLSVCGGNLQVPGSFSTLSVVSMPGSGSGLLVFDIFLVPTPWLGGTLMSPAPIVLGPIAAGPNGTFSSPVPLGGLLPPGWALYTQAVYVDALLPSSSGQTNAVRLQW